MPFDIHQSVFDEDELLEGAAYQYREQLIEQFQQSPEGQGIIAANQEVTWASHFIEFSHEIGLDIPEIAPIDVEEILFDVFPGKMSTPADSAPLIIRELIGFWEFLGREFQLPNADSILEMLRKPSIAEKLETELANPSNFGFAKSLVMQMMDAGVDPNDEAAVNRYMGEYNASLPDFPPLPDSLPPSMSAKKSVAKASKAKKDKRKTEKASRRKNRKRK